jgi:hypothetical protein
MQRSLSIFILSVALTLGPIGLKSSRVHGAAQEETQLQESSSRQASENRESQKSLSKSAAEPVKPEAETTADVQAAKKAGVRKPRRPSASAGLTRVQMQNVDFHIDDTIFLRIRNLRGALLRKNNATIPYFDDKQSFNFRIDSGTIGISADNLANLLNNYVFAYPKAPLKEVSITTEGGQIKMKGTVHKVTDLPFEIVGDLLATPEGKIQLHPTSIKTGGIPVKGLMNLFGIELDELIKGTESRGVKIDDNDITMDPEVMIPPPQVRGKITAIRIEGDEVIQVFGPANKSSIADSASRRRGSNFMHYRGGTIRFGKLTMTNADLRLVDRDPKTPFDFSMDHYNSQLVAGYSKNQPNLGLVVYVPDYYRVQRTASKANSAAGNTVSRR